MKLFLTATCGVALVAGAMSVARAQTYRLELRPSSVYHRQPCAGPCLCVHPGWTSTLSGTLDVRLVNIGNVFDFYAVENVNLAGSDGPTPVTLTGTGQYQQSGIAHQQILWLNLRSDTGTNYSLTSGIMAMERPLPYIGVGGVTGLTACSELTLSMIGVPACAADVDDGSGWGNPDQAVGIGDLIYYLGQFEAGGSRADVDNGQRVGLPDGAVTIDDLLYFLERFEAGC